MKELKTDITIHASAEKVWDILMDFEKYPEWNPFVQSIEGIPSEGETIHVRMQLEGGTAMTFKPKVLKVQPKKEFRWLGHLYISGLFDGEHYFQIEEGNSGEVYFTHGERFKGMLTSLFLSKIGESTQAGFEAMNLALKQRAEKN